MRSETKQQVPDFSACDSPKIPSSPWSSNHICILPAKHMSHLVTRIGVGTFSLKFNISNDAWVQIVLQGYLIDGR